MLGVGMRAMLGARAMLGVRGDNECCFEFALAVSDLLALALQCFLFIDLRTREHGQG